MIVRESTEWCRFYWFKTERKDLPRVLLIGDSIVAGYAQLVADRLEDQATVAFFSTSICVGDPAIYRQLDLAFAGYDFALVHFNNGLHGFTTTEPDYAAGLEGFVDAIEDLAPKAKHIWRNSTPITVKGEPAKLDPQKNPRVLERNRLATDIMTRREIPVDDLYSIAVSDPAFSSGDGYHYSQQGNETLADHVAQVISKALS
jgi:lysophospholipase L1-like esterase